MNIRTQPVTSLSIDELVLAAAFLGVVEERVHENGHDIPDVLKTELKDVNRELDSRLREDKERRLAVLRLRMEGLLTQAEKRKNAQAEIDALEAELGGRTRKAKAK